ncbi:helix-turn-helix domain-containing protein [Burkholderia sp. Ac-20345]|uniref:AraC-like ligand-binding domain-containing protein n=1 Tax=Burkholderia sp. Ac-20345 TaxID=2703891 RepID=UPI00197C6F2E|nr:helix-turn-helix domain-containing protein [Burkholderia sp. Ac-20345]MBN3780353.1 helix-turn-helix domain-containing protein [Burkholderia sp. Ac-20345]
MAWKLHIPSHLECFSQESHMRQHDASRDSLLGSSAGGSTRQRLSTAAVPASQRFEYWLDMICTTYVHLDSASSEEIPFFGDVEFSALGPLRFTRLSSNAKHVLRTPACIRKETEDYYLAHVQRTGHSVVCQDDRQAILSVGDFAVYDCTRPYALHFDGDHHDVTVLRLPRKCLETMVSGLDELTAVTVPRQSVAANLLITMLETLHVELDNLHPSSADNVSAGLVSIIAAGMHGLPGANLRKASNLQTYHLARIKAYLREHLRESGMTVSSIAQALSISPAHLNRLFRDEPLSVAKLMWQWRLEGCQRDLADPRQAERSVSDIAYSWGFSDVTHFSRFFREHVGVTPRDWRAAKAAHLAS